MTKQDGTSIYEAILQCNECAEFTVQYRFLPHCHGLGRRGIMIVGQCPSRASVEAGRYYNQGSLRTILEGIVDIDQDCYLSDVIKCDTKYLTDDNDDMETLAKHCGDRFLLNEVEILQPKTIVAAGKMAFKYLTGVEGHFSRRHGDGNEYRLNHLRIPVVPIIHPSYGNVHYGRVPHQRQHTYRESVRMLFTDIINANL